MTYFKDATKTGEHARAILGRLVLLRQTHRADDPTRRTESAVPLKTGKQPATKDPRDLQLSKYLTATSPAKRPAQVGHEDRMPKPRLMLGNGPDDSVQPGFPGAGCCVFSLIANAIRLANGIAGRSVNITGKEVIHAYSLVTGYDINQTAADGSNPTDRGTNMRTALNWWRNVGFTDADGNVHKLGAYAAMNPKNLLAMFDTIWHLDIGVALGIVFPSSAMTQFQNHQVWDLVAGAQDEGGHAILYDARRQYPMVETWADDHPATRAFIGDRADEAFALFMPEMLVAGKSPEGLNVAQLTADLASIPH